MFPSLNNIKNMRTSKRDWTFRVQVSNLEKNEFVFVVGNLPELGAWNHYQAMQLTKENSSSDLLTHYDNSYSTDFGEFYESSLENYRANSSTNNFEKNDQICSQKVALPFDADVEYRYFIAVICESNCTKNSAKTLIIRKWEAQTFPRKIKQNALLPEDALPDPDIFGHYDAVSKIERGWLTDETIIQFKLFNNPIKLWKNKLKDKKVLIKMTPVNLVRNNSVELPQYGGDMIDDSLSMDTQDVADQPAFNITEIAVMNDEECYFKYQDQFGRAYNEDDFIIFNAAIRYPETTAYLIDYYVHSSRVTLEEPPNHIGFSYVLPSTLQSSTGMLTVPITSTKHRPIGQLTIEYVTIKPILDYPWDMSITYSKHWEQSWSGLDVGHRGLGNSFTKNCANVRENTIASLKTAAYHGADLVEFDVQLSKDFVPVIYHDFFVSISLKRKKEIEAMDMLEIPVKDLTLEQLHSLKVYHVEEGREKNQRFFDEDLEDHQPFPTLQAALQELEQHIGFNIEIKWTMQLKDGTYELNHPFDLNMYLDIILKVVLEHGKNRRIIFSCFNPDICVMMRLKQNKYPVVFLTQGVTAKYPTYHDPRCQSIPMAMRHALAADILGINVHTEDILRDSSQVKLVKDRGLIIFCWGDDNNDKETIKHLKKLGLHALIYDKIDEHYAKESKESIFLVETRENAKTLIALAQSTNNQQACASETNSLPLSSVNESNVDNRCRCEKIDENCDNQQDKDISDLTKDFSCCAKSLCQSAKNKSFSNPIDKNEALKDCI